MLKTTDRIMPFGRYRGRRLNLIPAAYLLRMATLTRSTSLRSAMLEAAGYRIANPAPPGHPAHQHTRKAA